MFEGFNRIVKGAAGLEIVRHDVLTDDQLAGFMANHSGQRGHLPGSPVCSKQVGLP